MEIHLERVQEAIVLRVSGDLRVWGKGRETEPLDVLRAEAPPLPCVILNLSGIHHIDSLGIASLARVVIECGKRDLGLRVVLPCGFPREVLKQVRIFDAWPQFQDEASALAVPAHS